MTCNWHHGCKRRATPGYRSCAEHRKIKAAEMKRWRSGLLNCRCRRCGATCLSEHLCAVCLAYNAERRHVDKAHDLLDHAEMMEATRKPKSRCAVSGLTLEELRAIGQTLQVDRIDPRKGYVIGNMQLLAARLNSSKSSSCVVPTWQVLRLTCEAAGLSPEPDWEMRA